MKPQRIQLSRKRGFNLQQFSRKLNGLPAVNCSRPSKWGNPFRVTKQLTRQKAIENFKHHCVKHNIEAIKTELRGKNLACWCKLSEDCHCTTLLEIANS